VVGSLVSGWRVVGGWCGVCGWCISSTVRRHFLVDLVDLIDLIVGLDGGVVVEGSAPLVVGLWDGGGLG